MKKYLFILIIVTVFIPATGNADSFSAFTINPTSLKSGGVTAVSWTLDSTGHSLVVYCQTGVKAKKTDGSAIACNQKTTASAGASGSFGLILTNVSGSAQNVTIRINAKNADGTENDAVYQEGIVTVATVPEPILSFASASTSIASGSSVIYNWSAQYIDGVNFMFECKSGIAVSSASYTQSQTIPCGVPVFSADLGVSASQSFTFVNNNISATPIKVTLLPAIGGGMYDATRALTINQEVAVIIKKTAAITSFTSSKPSVFSGEVFKLSWNTEYANGVNFKFNCDSALMSVISTDSSGTASAVPCFAYAFANALPTSGFITVSATNTASIDIDLPVQIVPQLPDNTYDLLNSNIMRVTVLRPYAQGMTAVQIEQKNASAPIDALSVKFAAGIRARSSSNLKARALPQTSAAVLKTQNIGEQGVVIGGPKAGGGYVWWQVQWDNGITGWSAEDYLITANFVSASISEPPQKVSVALQNKSALPPPSASQSITVDSARFIFTAYLKRGSRGDEVSALQKKLQTDSSVYPEGTVSGYYGVLTEKAVGRFQEKYGIAKQGEEGYGNVGPKTRAKLNSL